MRLLETRNPSELTEHPLNLRIYGNAEDDEMTASVRENGVYTPLVVTSDGVVVSGHRRRRAAISAGLAEVPVTVLAETSGVEIEKLVILLNTQREKTVIEKAREFKELAAIHKKIAAEIQKAGGTIKGKGRAEDIAAKAVGTSRRTANKAAEVVEHIETLRAAGKEDEADALTEKLNVSVAAAHSEIADPPASKATPEQRVIPEHLKEIFANHKEFGSACSLISRAKKVVEKLVGLPSGQSIPVNQVIADLKNASRSIKHSEPHATCPTCNGRGGNCLTCNGRLYVTKDVYSQLREQER